MTGCKLSRLLCYWIWLILGFCYYLIFFATHSICLLLLVNNKKSSQQATTSDTDLGAWIAIDLNHMKKIHECFESHQCTNQSSGSSFSTCWFHGGLSITNMRNRRAKGTCNLIKSMLWECPTLFLLIKSLFNGCLPPSHLSLPFWACIDKY